MSNQAIVWAKDHPVGTGIGALVVVVLALLLFRGNSGGGSADSLNAAYYNALNAQTQAGNAIQLTKMQLDAATNQETIAASNSVDLANIKAAAERYAIDSNERINDVNTAAQSHAVDNAINLQNAALHTQEVVNGQNTHAATKQHNSFFGNLGGILGGIGSIAGNLFPLGI
jgi:hypothetical protein